MIDTQAIENCCLQIVNYLKWAGIDNDASAPILSPVLPRRKKWRFIVVQMHRFIAPYSLVMVSSRFRIVLATIVHAASSFGSMAGSTFDSPTPTSFRAASLLRR